jgi:ubiquitin-protein ligase
MESFPDYIEEVLITIKNKIQQRRLRNDCQVLFQNYDDLLVCQEENKNVHITVTENVNHNKVRVYRFEIENLYYPFHPPRIYVNDNSYLSMLRINGDFEKKWLKKLRGVDCLCCHSLHCSSNWSPAIRMNHIVDEIKNIAKLKRDIVNLLLAYKIKTRFNIPYADIESFLVGIIK